MCGTNNGNLKQNIEKEGMRKMPDAKAPIGVIDAGLGGYTVVKELQKILPKEDIIFSVTAKTNPMETGPRKISCT